MMTRDSSTLKMGGSSLMDLRALSITLGSRGTRVSALRSRHSRRSVSSCSPEIPPSAPPSASSLSSSGGGLGGGATPSCLAEPLGPFAQGGVWAVRTSCSRVMGGCWPVCCMAASRCRGMRARHDRCTHWNSTRGRRLSAPPRDPRRTSWYRQGRDARTCTCLSFSVPRRRRLLFCSFFCLCLLRLLLQAPLQSVHVEHVRLLHHHVCVDVANIAAHPAAAAGRTQSTLNAHNARPLASSSHRRNTTGAPASSHRRRALAPRGCCSSESLPSRRATLLLESTTTTRRAHSTGTNKHHVDPAAVPPLRKPSGETPPRGSTTPRSLHVDAMTPRCAGREGKERFRPRGESAFLLLAGLLAR